MGNPDFKPSRSIMCLSVQQPFAEFILNHFQPYAFRTFKTDFTGALIIHASKKFDSHWKERCSTDIRQIGQEYIDRKIISSKGLFKFPLSKFVGAVIMVGNSKNYSANWCQPNHNYFRFINPIKFSNPIDGRGHLRLFFPPPGFQKKLSQKDSANFRRLLSISKELGFKTEMPI